MEDFTFEVTEQAGERIDKAVASLEEEWSRTQIQTWVKDGLVLVNGNPVKTNYKTKVGDIITVMPPEPEEYNIEAENLDLEIVYEDQDVLVVNKPRGMVV